LTSQRIPHYQSQPEHPQPTEPGPGVDPAPANTKKHCHTISVNRQISMYNLARVFCDYHLAISFIFAVLELWLKQH